ncbi:unnamed protein product [Lactuca saligna]|uniref:Ribosomal RNA-processing protein 40 n=1 Tax=Lactuca saligna TaxID=75948 RepID=A0AA36E3F4_LACSI|nr:unnamed protein product [Lactuca saligna]
MLNPKIRALQDGPDARRRLMTGGAHYVFTKFCDYDFYGYAFSKEKPILSRRLLRRFPIPRRQLPSSDTVAPNRTGHRRTPHIRFRNLADAGKPLSNTCVFSTSTAALRLVVPGDVILDLSSMANQTIKLGGGLRQDGDSISVMKAGTLRFTKPNKYWVESSHKRYVPSAGDNVLGVVVDTKPENFLVDIKGPALAFLPVLAFEGGTRRNIPKFEVGTLLYVRVVNANTGMNPELSCMDANGKAAEYGVLKEGYMFESSTGLSRTLLSSPPYPVLEALGKKLSFEIAVGINGRFWVNASQSSTVILVGNAILKSESLSLVQQKIYLEKLLKNIQ